MSKKDLEGLVIPEHIGIIMDGNGRWAQKQGLERFEGHKAGARVFENICEYACDIGIKVVTFYAFSTENWKRPEKEVNALMELFRRFFARVNARESENEKKRMRIRYIGSRAGLPQDIVSLIDILESGTENKDGLTVNVALNYGGRNEILFAAKALAQRAAKGEIDPDKLTEEDISSGLFTAGQPDPDMIIRTGGEYRISNFLIWQSAYSELYFSDTLWPDFSPEDLDRAIIEFNRRNRRFGGV
ncbi:MAG: isoprenyl transferase [Clostridiales bacterium]|nr:isoprenyl transferase [Clostridiales bacterium]